jgi:hypothetical protein
MSFSRQISQADVIPFTDFPGYLAGKWYIPSGIFSNSAGSAPGAGSIRLFPGYIKQQCTLNALGVRISTLSAGGNVQAAIYANNPATMLPTGTPLVSSGNMSTTIAASVNAAISLQLGPGLYWFGTNCDNGTVSMPAISPSSLFGAQNLGSATQSADMAGTFGITGVSVAQTFGTWPDLTSASFAELANITNVALLQFKVASVP